MTARIVNMITRHPLQHMMYAHPRSADDALVVRTLQGFEPAAGQLWEREAERSPFDPETGEMSSRMSYIIFTKQRGTYGHGRW